MSDADQRGLFDELLGAPDRDLCPGARPVLSVGPDDEPDYLANLEEHEETRVVLERRGCYHGEWSVLGVRSDRDPVPLTARLHQRWHAARPIVLRGLVDPTEATEPLGERARLGEELGEACVLREFLERHIDPSGGVWELGGPARLADPERDLERHWIRWHSDPGTPGTPRMNDLWAKSAWLSTHEDDRSVRLRLSFGSEGRGDASRDLRRHRRVEELAELLLPECSLLHDSPALRERLETWLGDEVLFTQHIGYWNAPGGGALFHHDAFDEPVLGGQRGVVFTQLIGRTAWLALSVDDLAHRVEEFLGYLGEGELPWVRKALFRHPRDLDRALEVSSDPRRARRELVRPGCGLFGAVVERGPEFTAFLADGGHAHLLDPGDVIILPNHGLGRTCMHSVFCADEATSYGLSMAIREQHPPEPPPDAPRRSTRRRRGGRRRRRG